VTGLVAMIALVQYEPTAGGAGSIRPRFTSSFDQSYGRGRVSGFARAQRVSVVSFVFLILWLWRLASWNPGLAPVLPTVGWTRGALSIHERCGGVSEVRYSLLSAGKYRGERWILGLGQTRGFRCGPRLSTRMQWSRNSVGSKPAFAFRTDGGGQVDTGSP